MADPNEIDWARLAAIIDGEGCILISKRKEVRRRFPAYLLRVCVTNTDPRLFVWLFDRFGGCVTAVKHSRTSFGSKQIYKWYVSCRGAEKILRGCLPYFILKRDQAKVGLEFQATILPYTPGRGITIPDNIIAERERLKLSLHQLRWCTHSVPEEYRYRVTGVIQ